MAVVATQHIRRMRGGAQGQLMLCADGHLYVVKFQNNPQHIRVLANEMLASRLAVAAGLTAPHTELIEVSPWLIENTPELEMDFGRRRERCVPGLQFGSRFVGGLMPGMVLDYLPESDLVAVPNLREFAGMLALDKWTGNANGRQAVYVRKPRQRHYRAVFIDYGYCFHAGDWKFEDVPLRGVYYRNEVYRRVTGWECFEPWLQRIETMPADAVWAVANEIPPAWYGGDMAEMELLVEKLLMRRSKVRDAITAFRNSDRRPFPNWGKAEEEVAPAAWMEQADKATIAGRVN